MLSASFKKSTEHALGRLFLLLFLPLFFLLLMKTNPQKDLAFVAVDLGKFESREQNGTLGNHLGDRSTRQLGSIHLLEAAQQDKSDDWLFTHIWVGSLDLFPVARNPIGGDLLPVSSDNCSTHREPSQFLLGWRHKDVKD